MLIQYQALNRTYKVIKGCL